MNLRNKTMFIIGFIMFFLIIVLSIVMKVISLNSFKDLEDKFVYQHIQRVVNKLSEDIEQLNAVTADWAQWDDTYSFMKDRNKEYIEGNLTGDSLFNNRWHFILYLDEKGQVIHYKAHNFKSNQDQKIFEELLTVTLFTEYFKKVKRDTESKSGILPLSNGKIIFSAQPILTSHGEGPRRGTLVAGRILNQEEIDRIAKSTNLKVDINHNTKINYEDYTIETVTLKGLPVQLIIEGQYIIGQALLMDAYGLQSLEIAIKLPRDVYQKGVSSVYYLIGSIIIVGIAISVVMIWLLERSILSRLMNLSSNVKKIRKSRDLSSRVSVSGEDEISQLEEEFNKMLSSLEITQQRMKHTAYHDALTDLPNRLLFYESLDRLIAYSDKEKKMLAVIFIDLDKFKEINDTLGHDYGDVLLRKVAEGLRNTIRDGDVISRMGGDEFTVLLSNISSQEEVEMISKRILNELVTPFEVKDKTLSVSASLGISLYPKDALGIDQLIKKADQAMYKAKRNGGDRYYFYSSLPKD